MNYVVEINLWGFSLQLLEHLCVLYTLITLYSQRFSMKVLVRETGTGRNASGILFFTLLAVVSMFLPIQSYENGVILDLRLTIVMLASLYLGMTDGFIVTLLVTLFRIAIGGYGAIWWTVGAFFYGPVAVLIMKAFSSRRTGLIAATVVNTGIYLTILAVLSYKYGWFSSISPFAEPVNFRVLAFSKFFCVGLAVLILDSALLKLLALERKYSDLQEQANIDEKTGLLNYRRISEHLGSSVAKSVTWPISLLMIDIDHFKEYNDAFGHQAGDAVLKQVADIIGDCVARQGYVGRYGGEEFMVLLPALEKKEALVIGEKIRRTVALTEFPGRQVTVSVGIASFYGGETDEQSLIAAADEALYRAKHFGRNCVKS